MGKTPPPVEILHFPPGAGNGRTYTSIIPSSSEEYASQCPSGENAGAIRINTGGLNGFCRNETGLARRGSCWLVSNSAVQRCQSQIASRLLSGDTDDGNTPVVRSERRRTSPPPSARTA